MGLPRFSVERYITILMFFIAIIVIGIISLLRLPVELMPNNSSNTVTIRIGVRGGMPPTEVETRVTKIIEEAVASASHLKTLSSMSKEGESTVSLEFKPGTDMDFASLEVREKYSRIKDKLPDEIEKPIIAKFSKSDVPVVILALSSLRRTPEMLRKLVDDEIKERFMRVDGVANIDIGGGRERKIIIDVEESKLSQYGLSIHQLVNIVGLNNMNLLVGNIEKWKSRYLIRTIGLFDDIEKIKRLPIAKSEEGTMIRVFDIAKVKDTFLEPKGFARLNLRPVVSLYIQKESSANTVRTVHAILEKKKLLEEVLPSDIKIKIINNQSEKIEDAIKTVKQSLIYGAFLAILILYCFLRNIKATFVVGSAIPISVVATFIFMNMSGNISINIMTLSGLALGIGMLVDSAIVVLENTFKYKEQGLSDVRASILGSEQMVMSIIASTITTIIVFFPIIFLNDTIRLEYSGLAFTVTFSLLASLLVSVSLIPMLFSRLEVKHTWVAFFLIGVVGVMSLFYYHPFDFALFLLVCIAVLMGLIWLIVLMGHRFSHRFKSIYRRLLFSFMRYRYKLTLVVFVALLVSIYHFKKLDKDLYAAGDSRKFTAFVELPSGAKLERSNETVRKIEQMFREMPEVEHYSSRVEGWSSKVYVTLVPKYLRTKSAEQIIDELRPQVKNFKDAFIYFQREAEGEKKEIVIDLYGYDYKVLKNLTTAISTRFSSIPEFKDIKIRMREGRPELHIFLNRESCRYYGLSLKKVAEIVHAKMRGLRASTYSTKGKEIEIIARLRNEDRDKVSEIKKLHIPLAGGSFISLDQIAEFDFELGPSEIWRKNKSRMIQMSATRSTSLSLAVEKAKAALAGVEFPDDYYYRMGEEYLQLKESSRQMLIALALTIILIYLVLASLFESYYQPFIILMTVPLSLIGVTFFFKFKGMTVTMGSMIGFIMLGGIVVNNAIILIDTVNRMVLEGKFRPLRGIVTAGQNRMRPIIMTTVTTLLGLLPMALDDSESSKLWTPLAITVISGLFSSTFLTLFVIPCIYIILEEWKKIIHSWRTEGFSLKFLKKKKSKVSA